MLDRLFLPVLALAAIAAVALAMVWPQGYGDRSPGRFGSTPVQRTPAMQAAMQREALAQQRRGAQNRVTVRDLQAQAIAPSQ
jgi:Flp pilus assembly protein TadB